MIPTRVISTPSSDATAWRGFDRLGSVITATSGDVSRSGEIPLATPITQDQVLEALRSVALAYRNGTAPYVRCFVEDRQLLRGYDTLLPAESDTGLGSYARRIGGILGARWAIVVNDLHTVHIGLWRAALALTDALFGSAEASTGATPRAAQIGLFMGAYPDTPFGLHHDDLGVVALSVLGTKLFSVWPADAFGPSAAGRYREIDPQQHTATARVLTCQSGQAAWWGAWLPHVGHGEGVTVTLSFGFSTAESYDAPLVSRAITEAMARATADPLLVDLDPKAFRRAFRRAALQRASARGFQRLPPAAPRPVTTAFRAAAPSTIIIDAEDRRIYGLGREVVLPADVDPQHLADALARSLDAPLVPGSGGLPPSAVELLRSLASAHALCPLPPA